MLHHVLKDLKLSYLKFPTHGDVRFAPVSHDGPLLETFPLFLDCLGSQTLCHFSYIWAVHGDGRCALFLQRFHLDRQSMAIPSRDVVDALSLRELKTTENILQYLIKGMANVQIAIGVGRAIMEGEGGLTDAFFGLLCVEVAGASLQVFPLFGGERTWWKRAFGELERGRP